MARKSNHRTVVFLQDFATKKEGEEWSCDSMLASSLVHSKVAEYKMENSSDEVSNPTETSKQKSLSKSKNKK